MTPRPIALARVAAAVSLAVLASASTPTRADNDKGKNAAASWKLDNGLEVAYQRVPHTPLVSVQVWYRVGSKDEPENRRGMARLLQLLMFEGSDRVRPGDHSRWVRQYGGLVNAGVTEDATYFQNTVPAAQFGFALELEAERMRGLLFRDSAVAMHRDALIREIQAQRRAPLTSSFDRFLAESFTRHPYRFTAAGDPGHLRAMTAVELKAFYDRYYHPNNALVVVVGDLEPEEVEKQVRARFGGVPEGPKIERPADALSEPEQKEAKAVVGEPAPVGFVIHGYRMPAARGADVNALQLLALILSSGEESLLHRRLVVDSKVAQQAGGQAMVREHPGLLVLLATFNDAKLADAVDSGLREVVASVRAKPVPKPVIEGARRQLLSNFYFGLESVAGVGGHLGQSWVLTGDPQHFWKDAREFKTLTAADLQAVAKKYLIDGASTSLVVPIGKGAGE